MKSSNSHRLLTYGMYIVPLLFLVVFCYSLFAENLFLGAEDDAFFYCRIADSVSETGRISFDGITDTNGFHPLWLGMLILLRFLFADQFHFLTAVAVLSLILMSTAGLMALKYYIRRFTPIVGIAVLFFLVRYIRDFSCMSMETSLLIPLAVFALILAGRLNAKSTHRELLLLGFVIALAFLARLDSLLLGFFIFIAAVKKTGKKAIVPLIAPCAVAALGYITANKLLVGEWFSVSASMKASGFGFNTLFARQLFTLSDPLGFRSPWGLYLLFLVMALPCCFWKKLSLSGRIASFFILAFTLIQLFFSQWRLWYWYAYPAVLFLIFAVPPILQILADRIRLPERIKGILAAVLLVITVGAAAYWAFSYNRIPERDFRYRNMMIALELNELLPDSSVIAMGDRSGSFAYFFHGHVIQAEGLAGDFLLAEAIQEGQLEHHLETMGADYILSWTGPHEVENYNYWEIVIPDKAQSSVFNNVIQVQSCYEILRWVGEEESAFLWRLYEN